MSYKVKQFNLFLKNVKFGTPMNGLTFGERGERR